MELAQLTFLKEKIDAAKIGSSELSKFMFIALGGIIKIEPTSKQGGQDIELPYWPNESDPCMGVEFTTNLSDLDNFMIKNEIEYELLRVGDGYEAEISEPLKWTMAIPVYEPNLIKRDYISAPTAPLALCRALLRSEYVVKNIRDLRPPFRAPEYSKVLSRKP